MALPKPNRLRKRQDFSTIYRSGLRRSTAHLTLRALQQTNLHPNGVGDQVCGDQAIDSGYPRSIQLCPTQLGISVSQKVSKRAVVRNLIKRRLRVAFFSLLPQMSSGWQIVIVVKPGAAECDYEQFLQELKQLLINAEVMNGS